MNDSIDFSIIDKHIIGRVTPHIYAFSTGTVPSYLKVGDTYRPVTTRLAEWRQVFPDLESHFQAPATLGEQQNTYFRDYSVHRYLEDHDHSRLQRRELNEDVYYSREFFRDTTPEDIEQAIEDIRLSYETNDARYALYDASSTLPQLHTFTRSDTEWTLRPNQQQAVDNFQGAVERGRTNLLMYAVMRFGKSFTSLSCAQAIKAKSIAVVSAKADVLTEWKKTTEIPANFKGFHFLTTRELDNDANAITKTISNGEVPVVFLTLQDLQGSDMKERHRQVFDNCFDILIIDESHYGARAQSYGQVLPGLLKETNKNRDSELAENVDPDEADRLIKVLNAKVSLHLSGTPYRILMGSEFTSDDIVAFVQFSDIVHEQETWDRQHLNKDGTNEWDNPYFGFPQMVRFAFNLNESSHARIEHLRKQGISATLSALLQPRSVKQDPEGGEHKKFKYEAEVLDLLRIIDGSQTDPNILGFLDYDKIKAGSMCRHMVMVLPYKASCDAMEALLIDHAEEFKNLASYEILNISGLSIKKSLRDTESVKVAIASAEAKGKKTITLTVNKMLTGSTVEQWDTMLFLKDTSSPQEYDQAIFRLQNQYVREFEAREGQDDGQGRLIRHCLKPQTLLVDFDPIRMFRMQEQKSLIYNVNTDERGNDQLEERLKEELRISPIITLNSHLIKEVQPTDILQAISNYNADRTITDEVMDLPVDLELLKNTDLRTLIEAQAEIGSRQGLDIRPNEGEGDEPDIPPAEGDETNISGGETDREGTPESDPKPTENYEIVSLEKKMRTYFQRILFFAMLAQEPIDSLGDIVNSSVNGDHPRILKNLGLDLRLLALFRTQLDPFKLSQLDYKIQNISRLARDQTLPPLERAYRALNKVNRLSESEIRTPAWLCKEVIDHFSAEHLISSVATGGKILDIASKFGEFSLALYQRLLSPDVGLDIELVKSAIYAIPTSTVAYEFTRRIFEIAGLDPSNVTSTLNTYDLLDFLGKEKMYRSSIGDRLMDACGFEIVPESSNSGARSAMKFAAIVGNPPYQISDGGAQSSAQPIYHKFVELSRYLRPERSAFIIPTRWFAGGKPTLKEFRNTMLADRTLAVLHDFRDPSQVFPGTNNRGGVCYFILDTQRDTSKPPLIISHLDDGTEIKQERFLEHEGVDIFIRDSFALNAIERLQHHQYAALSEDISPLRPFGLRGYFVKSEQFRQTNEDLVDPIECIGKRNLRGYLERTEVPSGHDMIDIYKVFIPRANNIGTELSDDNLNAFVGLPGQICTESYLVVHPIEDTLDSAKKLRKYLQTKFVRFLHSAAKAGQDATSKTFVFVPSMASFDHHTLDWDCSTDELDEQLFEIFGFPYELRSHIRQSIRSM